jgi:hypothetical protein
MYEMGGEYRRHRGCEIQAAISSGKSGGNILFFKLRLAMMILNWIFNKWVPKLLTGLPGSLQKLGGVCSECGGQVSLPYKGEF